MAETHLLSQQPCGSKLVTVLSLKKLTVRFSIDEMMDAGTRRLCCLAWYDTDSLSSQFSDILRT